MNLESVESAKLDQMENILLSAFKEVSKLVPEGKSFKLMLYLFSVDDDLYKAAIEERNYRAQSRKNTTWCSVEAGSKYTNRVLKLTLFKRRE
jgi:hypothetical protein